MNILKIQNFNITPTFGIRKIGKTEHLYVSEPDTFEHNKINQKFNKFYDKIESDIYTPDDVRNMALRISKKTNIPKDEIYSVMGILSQYSSYKSLKNIKDYLKENNISLISNSLPYYEYKKSDNSPCLTNVMHYISLRNFNFAKDSSSFEFSKKALFLDSDLINIIKNMSEKDKSEFYKICLKNDKTKVIYLKNFENGYNILNQKEDFETFTTKTIEKAKKISKKYNKPIKKSVEILLNAKNIKEFKNLGIEYETISQELACSPEQIANNLNPVVPTRQEMLKLVDKVANRYSKTQSEFEKSKNDIIDFLDNANTIITPQKYCKYLKTMHKEINKYIKQQGKSLDDVYYLIPSKNKSYIITNYQYQKTNDIKNPKNIYIDGSAEDYKTLSQKIKPNSTVVFLDDCAISGLSYTKDIFAYDNINNFLPKDKNINIIFAPMVASETGIDRIKTIRARVGRDEYDKIICPKILQPNNKFVSDDSVIRGSLPKNETKYITSLLFPYMGPDSNSELLIPIYEKFFIVPEAQKVPLGSFDYIDSPFFN